MLTPPLSPDEPIRLEALRNTQLLNTPLEERFERITRLARLLLDVPIAAVSLLDADRQWFKSIQGLDVEETSRDVSFCGHTILGNDVFVVPDTRTDERFADNPLVTQDPRIVFYAGCPLHAEDGSNIASLCVIDQKPRQFSEEDANTLRDLAALAQSELRAHINESVQHDMIQQLVAEQRKALVDTLTRLWNRQGIMDILNQALQEARADSVPLTVFLIDLDHFKEINDAFGHLAGDEVLRETAKRMLGAVRSVDAIGRFGGEEFLIVLKPGEDAAEAMHIAERVRQSLSADPIQTAAGNIVATASIGVAFLVPPNSHDAEWLLHEADTALYAAKEAGRNKVWLSSARSPEEVNA
jgi:diguanylate cyclase (GGDEF)-like protein